LGFVSELSDEHNRKGCDDHIQPVYHFAPPRRVCKLPRRNCSHENNNL
jgi:hypothetical protein